MPNISANNSNIFYIFGKLATSQEVVRLTNENDVENNSELKELIKGCLRNKRRSQELLFKRFYGKMLGVCLRYSKDMDTAQETLQQGFIKVFDKLEMYNFKGSFEGWMRRIMANTAIDYIRKHKKDPWLSDSDTDFSFDPVNPIIEKEEKEMMSIKGEIALEAIQQLSPAYQAVFNLYVLEEYTHREIAEKLGISEGTSKSNLSKAKANLQEILNKKFMNID